MASQSYAVRKRPETHRWRGVVEDFIALKPDQHSYECVLQHTENLLCKMKREKNRLGAMVSQGVIRPLVVILDHKDVRDSAKLQHTAVKALTLIMDKGFQSDLPSVIAAAGGIPILLSLLKLQLDEVARDVLQLLNSLVVEGDTALVSNVPGCVEAFIETTRSEMWTVKHTSLLLIESVFDETMPSAQKISGFLRDLVPLLDAADAETVSCTSDVFKIVTEKGDTAVIEAMMSIGVLPHFLAILQKGIADQDLLESAETVLSCLGTLARRSKDCAREILRSGCLGASIRYLHPHRKDTACIRANKILTSVISGHDDDILAEMIERKLVPPMWMIFPNECLPKQGVLSAVLLRLLTNNKYLQEYLEPHFLSYLASLQNSGEWCALYRLLTIFKAALEETESQGKLAEVRAAINNCGFLENLVNLQNCPDKDVSSVSVEVAALCLK